MESQFQTSYEYTPEHHSNGFSKGKFIIQRLQLLKKDVGRISPNEKLHFALQCFATEDWENVKLRFEIQFQDGTIAGTVFSDQGFSIRANETKQLQMTFDSEHIVPGRYRVDIVAYIYNEYGQENPLDGVYPGFNFEVVNELDEDNELNWLHQYWGHVHLHDVLVEMI